MVVQVQVRLCARASRAQSGDPLIKTLHHSITNGQSLQTAPLPTTKHQQNHAAFL